MPEIHLRAFGLCAPELGGCKPNGLGDVGAWRWVNWPVIRPARVWVFTWVPAQRRWLGGLGYSVYEFNAVFSGPTHWGLTRQPELKMGMHVASGWHLRCARYFLNDRALNSRQINHLEQLRKACAL